MTEQDQEEMVQEQVRVMADVTLYMTQIMYLQGQITIQVVVLKELLVQVEALVAMVSPEVAEAIEDEDIGEAGDNPPFF